MAVIRANPEQEPTLAVGIGGWLWIPILLFVWSVVDAVHEGADAHEQIITMGLMLWHAFITPGTILYHSAIVLEIFTSVLIQMVLVVLSCVALYALIAKKKYAPKLAILVYVIGLSFAVFVCYVVFLPLASISAELSRQIAQQSVIKLIAAFVNLVVWVPYFRKSGRVARTFTKD